MGQYSLSRYSMYTKISQCIQSVIRPDMSDCWFMGENGDSGIIGIMNDLDVNCNITDRADIDIMSMKQLEDNSIPILVTDQVLEHVENPFLAVNEMYRVLKPGGLMILTTCLMNPIHYESGENHNDYWRFTPRGLEVLCKDFHKVYQCSGAGDYKLLYMCMKGHRHDIVTPGSDIEKIAWGDDGRTYIHVWIVAEK